MNKHISIPFKFKYRMYSVTLKISVEDITLSMLEDRIYKKLSLDERKDKLELSYIPMVVGCVKPLTIVDDDYIEPKMAFVVETSGRSEQLDKLSRAGKSYVGENYEDLQPLEDEIGPNAVTLYVGHKKGNNEVMEGKNDDDTTQDDCIEADTCIDTDTVVETDTTVENDTGMETDTVVLTTYKYTEQPPAVESSKYIEEWGDGLSLSKYDELPSKYGVIV
ncbi:hypothetical protein N665_0067s0035 [Sinapis alba]|nr:hypothetical protein N665_0067s0035 [Sinapis alba]